jgi:hypothetical protein
MIMPGLLAPMPKLPARPYVPAPPHMMWQGSGTLTNSGFVNRSIRMLITPLIGAGKQFRFWIDGGTDVVNASFQVQAVDYNTLYAPIEILWTNQGYAHGYPGLPGGAGARIASDWMLAPNLIDNSMNMIVVLDIGSLNSNVVIQGDTHGAEMWAPTTAVKSTYNIASPTGTWHAYPGTVLALLEVEAQ